MKPEEKEEITQVKKSENKQILTHFKWSGIATYFKELSIVIIGILITLGITTAISNYNRQKELSGMLRLVKEELIENREGLIRLKEKWYGEQKMYSLIKMHIKDVSQIPADTFQKYQYSVGGLYSFNAKDESYDVLKSSVLTQYIQEKELKYRLSSIYRSFRSLDEQLMEYSRQKSEDTFPLVILEMNDGEISSVVDENNTETYFRVAIKNKRFRKFLLVSKSILGPDIFEYNISEVSELIRKMEEYGY